MKEDLCRAVCIGAINSMVVVDGRLYKLYIHKVAIAQRTIVNTHKNTEALQDWQDQGHEVSEDSYISGEVDPGHWVRTR